MPAGGLCHRAFTARQNGVLRLGPEPRPDPRGDRQFGGRRPGRQPGRPLYRRNTRRTRRRARPAIPRRSGRGGDEEARVHGARRAEPRQGGGRSVDLRPFFRLRENQRRVPYLSEELELILKRLEQLLPPPAPATDWSASIAFRWRASGRPGMQGWLQPVRQVHRIRLADLRGIDRQIERVEENTRQFLEGRPANNVLLTG